MGQHYHHFSALERNVLQRQLNLGRSQAQSGRPPNPLWRGEGFVSFAT